MNLGYSEVEQTLKLYECDVDPAYFHGMLSGLIAPELRRTKLMTGCRYYFPIDL